MGTLLLNPTGATLMSDVEKKFVRADGWEVTESRHPLLLKGDRVFISRASSQKGLKVRIMRAAGKGARGTVGVGKAALDGENLRADFGFAMVVLILKAGKLDFQVESFDHGDHTEGGGSMGPPTGGH